jgi:hypothetical protein
MSTHTFDTQQNTITLKQALLYEEDPEYHLHPEKFCEICSLKLTSDCVKLHCKHCFHYNCLVYSLSNSNMCCPYCTKKIDYIPLLKNQIPIKNMHKEYEEYIKKENEQYKTDKTIVILSGKYKEKTGKIKSVSEKMLTVIFDTGLITRIKKENIKFV